MSIKLREWDESKFTESVRDHLRNHVYVNISVTDRNTSGKGYTTAGYRLWIDRESWYGGTDEERSEALAVATNRIAELTHNQPEGKNV